MIIPHNLESPSQSTRLLWDWWQKIGSHHSVWQHSNLSNITTSLKNTVLYSKSKINTSIQEQFNHFSGVFFFSKIKQNNLLQVSISKEIFLMWLCSVCLANITYNSAISSKQAICYLTIVTLVSICSSDLLVDSQSYWCQLQHYEESLLFSILHVVYLKFTIIIILNQ